MQQFSSKMPKRVARQVTPGSSAHFVAATEQLETGTSVVSVIGEVDHATAPAFEETLRAVPRDSAGEMIVDLSGCSFLDSRALSALVETKKRLAPADRPLALVLANPY